MSLKGVECQTVFRIKGGNGVFCVGFTEKNPPDIPEYDVIHLCWLTLENAEKTDKCRPSQMASATPKEAVMMGVHLIRAATLYEARKSVLTGEKKGDFDAGELEDERRRDDDAKRKLGID